MPDCKIAFGAVALSPDRMDGLNRYSSELLKEFLQSGVSLTAYTTQKAIAAFDSRDTKQVRSLPFNVMGEANFKGNISRLIWHQTALPFALMQDRVNAFYSPVPEGMLWPICPQVITIHDLLPVLFPDVYPRLKYYFTKVLPRIAKASQAIVVVSEATKKDVEQYYGIPSDRLHVVYQGYRSELFKPATSTQVVNVKFKYDLNNFILCVGETRPYKNIRRLIEAFSRLNLSDLQLAIVGKSSKIDPDLNQLPQQLQIQEKVKFLGYVSDEDLAVLYRAAQAFVFPSLYEGFGIPPLEAMACGCPAIVSHAASLPEVCGDAAYYVNPLDTEAIAAGIHQVVTQADLQQDLRLKGLQRAKNFSYQQTAAKILQILNSIQSPARV